MEAQQKSLATISLRFFIQIFAIPMVSVIFLPSYLAGVLKLLGSPRVIVVLVDAVYFPLSCHKNIG